MPNRLDPRTGYNRSNHQLGRSMLGNPLRDFLKDLAKRDRVEKFFDFSDWSETTSFTLGQTQTSVSFTAVDLVGGVMAGTAVGVSTANISAIYKTRTPGNYNPTAEFRWKINVTTASYIVECGFVNAAPTTGAAAVADIDTPAFFTNVTNAAIIGIYTNQTHANFAFATLGGFTGQTVASTLLTTSNSMIISPATDTYVTCKVQIITDPDETSYSKAYAWINGRLVASHDTDPQGHIDGAVAIYPFINVQTVTTTARIFSVDYISISHDRSALGVALE